ncbi:hypothetical protein HG717_34300 [Rhodococcus erythropolis]|uniref:hypothetical protein n=1 Tax=Rhodococcus erythropolis TaxID=1833 RepID=UPI001C9BB090|nr:hypothetical protein [Rhodococcus erythropolis]MBY6388941.1 hypothetical protein [Rhodococcus erythropolis]
MGDYLAWIIGSAGLVFLVCDIGRRLVAANRTHHMLIENFEPAVAVTVPGHGDGVLGRRTVP